MRQIFSQGSDEYGSYGKGRRGWPTTAIAFGTATVVLVAALWLWPGGGVTRTEDAAPEALSLVETATPPLQRGQGKKRPSLRVTAPERESDLALLSADADANGENDDDDAEAMAADDAATLDDVPAMADGIVEASAERAAATPTAKTPRGKTKRNENKGRNGRTTTTAAATATSSAEGTTTSESETTSTSQATSTTQRRTTTTAGATTTTAQRETTTTQRRTTTTQRRTTTTARATTTTAAPTTTTQRQTTTTQRQTTTTQEPGGTCFRRIMRDDFSGSELASHWVQFYSVGNAGYGLRRPSANTVRDGKLIITAANNSDGVLTSGGMNHTHAQTYGKYRFRVRTDADYEEATSGVILTWPSSNNQPRDGETNIYETGWGDPSRSPFFSYVHEPFQHSGPTQQAWLPHYADGTQWQTMTMEWTPSQIRIVREGPGQKTWTEQIVKEKSDDDVIPDVPHRLHIQLDNWKNSSPNTIRMEVDWVEIYEYCG